MIDSPLMPDRWSSCDLGEIADVQLGKMLDRKQTGGTLGLYLRNINVRWGTIDTSDLLEMHFKDTEMDRYSLRPGDVLVCEGGEPGRAAVWTAEGSIIKYQKALHRVRLAEGLLPKWLTYQLQFDALSGALAAHFTGTTIQHLPREAIREYQVRIAPREEQRRIVETIDSYFTRLDDAAATLSRVQANLRRYRASVLTAAVEGRLVPTEADLARADGRDYEPAPALLEGILARRAEGSRRDEPPEFTRSTPLPEGWCWCSVDQLGDVSGGLTQNAKREDWPLQVPYLRVANVYASELRLDDVRYIGVTESELNRALLASGDLLVVEGNGSIQQLGRVALWNGSVSRCAHQNHLIKVRFSSLRLATWTLNWLLSPGGRMAIEQVASSTSGLHTLSLSKVGRLPVPLPPLAEQSRAIQEVDRLMSLATTASHESERAVANLPRLRQSVLGWAFQGTLVDQDPADQPASALLDAIGVVRRARGAPHANGRRQAKGSEPTSA